GAQRRSQGAVQEGDRPARRRRRDSRLRGDLTMPAKKFKPITPGTRFRSVASSGEITRDEPEKSLLEPLKKSGGRNHHGRITSRRRGGGAKRMYRRIDFKRDKHGVGGTVRHTEDAPDRTANIALIQY